MYSIRLGRPTVMMSRPRQANSRSTRPMGGSMLQATRRSSLLALVVLVVVSLLVGSPAGADPRRITQGDAQAILNAFGTGGLVIFANGTTTEGAPADFFGSHGSIRPFPQWARHFCAEDWHVIVLAAVDGGDASYTRQQAEAILDPITLTFTLDGEPLDTTRTVIKPYLAPELLDLERAWYFQQGRVMSPADLSVGSHHLVVTWIEPGFPTFELEITFFIDGPGTGACL